MVILKLAFGFEADQVNLNHFFPCTVTRWAERSPMWITICDMKMRSDKLSGTREPGGPGGAATPPTLEHGGQYPSGHAPPPQFLHVTIRGIGDCLLYKAFHDACCIVKRNFAVKS